MLGFGVTVTVNVKLEPGHEGEIPEDGVTVYVAV